MDMGGKDSSTLTGPLEGEDSIKEGKAHNSLRLLWLLTLQEGSILSYCGGEAVKDALQPLQLLALDQPPSKICAATRHHQKLTCHGRVATMPGSYSVFIRTPAVPSLQCCGILCAAIPSIGPGRGCLLCGS